MTEEAVGNLLFHEAVMGLQETKNTPRARAVTAKLLSGERIQIQDALAKNKFGIYLTEEQIAAINAIGSDDAYDEMRQELVHVPIACQNPEKALDEIEAIGAENLPILFGNGDDLYRFGMRDVKDVRKTFADYCGYVSGTDIGAGVCAEYKRVTQNGEQGDNAALRKDRRIELEKTLAELQSSSRSGLIYELYQMGFANVWAIVGKRTTNPEHFVNESFKGRRDMSKRWVGWITSEVEKRRAELQDRSREEKGKLLCDTLRPAADKLRALAIKSSDTILYPKKISLKKAATASETKKPEAESGSAQ
jgi:hypothetical protein